MEKNSELISRAVALEAALATAEPREPVTSELRSWLREATAELTRLRLVADEQALLRNDLVERIVGMAKAIAVVHCSEEQLREAAGLVDDLAAMNSSDLLSAYRRVSTRFRDTFRSTFDPNALSRTHAIRAKSDARDFK